MAHRGMTRAGMVCSLALASVCGVSYNAQSRAPSHASRRERGQWVMIRIYFSSSPDPLRQAVPLAQACGIGRQPAFLFERSLERLNRDGPQLWSLTTDPGAADLFVYPYGSRSHPQCSNTSAVRQGLRKLCGDAAVMA